MSKPALDKDLKRLTRLEHATRGVARGLVPLSLALLFLVVVGIATASFVGVSGSLAVIVAASVIGGYMALNIGANDVANNMSPAVGSRALHIGVAVAIAAVFEAAGAILAGGDVVATVSSGIIRPDHMPNTGAFTTAMLAALFAAALWINLATWIGAPVSTTHSVVGGVLGGGVAMAGLGAADWSVVLRIVASWVVSPVLGGVIAASFLLYIKLTILYVPDQLEQARRRVPLLVAIMAGAFTTYLMLKGFSRVWKAPVWLALSVGGTVLLLTVAWLKPVISRKVKVLPPNKSGVGNLFTIPVICGAALLSFAHGANDVANAIGPLAAIYASVTEGGIVSVAKIPPWILLTGAFGIATGLLLYGPKLIRTVGSKITKLNRVRAFCVTLSAAITVIIASALGLPVSSTHIAIGALFGVGFLREFMANRRARNGLEVMPLDTMPLKADTDFMPDNGDDSDPAEAPEAAASPSQEQGKSPEKLRKRKLVRRSHLLTIIAAWLITVPASAGVAALIALALARSGLPGLG
ncbi:MAG TPA: inorganic phosphate transporter [Gammaproteobacteria bacterium]|nr:inorganic phosphate transporter [Gammaproteobacteria bacterium]HRP87788.1 inorganic phosphate transporter [Gammaproteobacteria bacterium]